MPLPSRRRGFSMIELLFVMVVMGILVLIGIPKYRDAKRKAQREMVITHLRNLMTSEEAYYTIYSEYTSDPLAMHYQTLPTITVDIPLVTDFGFHASASESIFGVTCYVTYGNAPPFGPATVTNLIACQ